MRHIISILLENQAGALARVASLFSTRGYNIESLNVAPTDNEAVSRLTVVTSGSDEVIQQISKQVGKLVDVVNVVDMTRIDHIERELALFKVRAPESSKSRTTRATARSSWWATARRSTGSWTRWRTWPRSRASCAAGRWRWRAGHPC
jgi:acetolactate synthase-1/3 small subunit